MTNPTTYKTVSLPGTSSETVGAPPAVSAALRPVRHHAFTIDPEAADTATFLDRYQWPAEAAANTIVVAGKGGGAVTYAVCVALSTTRLDMNRAVKTALGVRKVSFAPVDYAVSATGMEHGAITPFGTPAEWPILVDTRVTDAGVVVVGGGRRLIKVVVDGRDIAALPSATVISGLAEQR